MKKIYLVAAVAIAALSFSSCGKNTKPAANADSAVIDTLKSDSTVAEVPADATALTSELASKLKAGDASGIAALLTGAQSKVAELAKTNPAQAKEYVTKLQEWVKGNEATVKSVIDKAGDGAVGTTLTKALSTVKSVDPSNLLSSLKNATTGSATDAAASVSEKASAAKEGMANAASEAKNAASDAKDAATEAVTKKADEAKEAASKAADKASEAASSAASKAVKGLGL